MRRLAVVLAACALAACSDPRPPPAWSGGPPPTVDERAPVGDHAGQWAQVHHLALAAHEDAERAAAEAAAAARARVERERATRARPARQPAATGSVWDRLAACESGGRWHIATGNGYYGGLQFSLSSWRAVGGTGYPHEHSRETQIAMAERLRARQGWGAWPTCSRKLGLR